MSYLLSIIRYLNTRFSSIAKNTNLLVALSSSSCWLSIRSPPRSRRPQGPLKLLSHFKNKVNLPFFICPWLKKFYTCISFWGSFSVHEQAVVNSWLIKLLERCGLCVIIKRLSVIECGNSETDLALCDWKCSVYFPLYFGHTLWCNFKFDVFLKNHDASLAGLVV